MYHYKSLLFCFVSVGVLGAPQVEEDATAKNGADVGFPEQEKPDVERTNTRVPLYIPGKCPDNQLLYPGNQKNDWVCDCRPGYVYRSAEDGCFAVYRQGPCDLGQFLILKKGEFIPECVRNDCNVDGQVRYQDKCYELNKTGEPCKPVEEGGGVFGVNSTNLELGCLIGTDRLSILQFPTNCPPGSQRDRTNRCRETYG